MTPKEAVDVYVSSGKKIDKIGAIRESKNYFYFFTKKAIKDGYGLCNPGYVVIKEEKKLSRSSALRFNTEYPATLIPREEWDAESEPEAQPE